MSSVRNMFEQKGGSAPLPAATNTKKKTPSKWETPTSPVSHDTPVTPTNVTSHDDGDVYKEEEDNQQAEELPPVGMSRSLVAKFSQIESQQPSGPVRAESHQRQYAAPPSSVEYTEPPRSERARQSQTPDSGIGEVVNTSDDQLPEQGTTQNLLAQWRNKEQSSNVPAPRQTMTQRAFSSEREPTSQRHTPQRHTPERQQSEPAYHHQSEMDYSDGPEVVRPSGEVTEKKDDELPPPSTTKNLLAKFQTIQAEAQRDAVKAPPVKKVRTFHYYMLVTCILL